MDSDTDTPMPESEYAHKIGDELKDNENGALLATGPTETQADDVAGPLSGQTGGIAKALMREDLNPQGKNATFSVLFKDALGARCTCAQPPAGTSS